MSKGRAIVWRIVVVLVALSSGCAGWGAEANTSGVRYELPVWHEGDWWEYETSYIDQGALPGPEWMPPRRIMCRMEAICDVEGYRAYKVSVCSRDKSTGQLSAPVEFLYFATADLSLVRHEKMKNGSVAWWYVQTPGQPTWHEGTYVAAPWPVFSLVDGKVTKTTYDDPWRIRLPDGTEKYLGEGRAMLGRSWKPGEVGQRQEVSTEKLTWNGEARSAFRVRFRTYENDGRIGREAIQRWIPGIGWPVQGWKNQGSASSWYRLVGSSQGPIPRPKVEGFEVEGGFTK